MQAGRYYVRNFTIDSVFQVLTCDVKFIFLSREKQIVLPSSFSNTTKKTNKATLSILSDKREEIEAPDGNFAIFNEGASISLRVTSNSLECDQTVREQ